MKLLSIWRQSLRINNTGEIVDDYVKTTAKNNGMTMKEVRNMIHEDRELLKILVDDHLKRMESANA